LGDNIHLTLTDGKRVLAKDYKLTFSNKMALSYGQINALGGDFYGTYYPISDGKTQEKRSILFKLTWDTLNTAKASETTAILKVLWNEVEKVNEAIKNGLDPSEVYAKLPDVTGRLLWITRLRYALLAKYNWDHFGRDARVAYNAGHGLALDEAIRGNLDLAYKYNAFADHFLEDSFSSGHLRTPRRALHSNIAYNWPDVCAKVPCPRSRSKNSSCTTKTAQLDSTSKPRPERGNVMVTSGGLTRWLWKI
jgi:hypothetical protein